jgi:hypothetical protein
MSIVGFYDRVLKKHLVKTNEKSGSVSYRVFLQFLRRDCAPLTCVSPNSRFWRLYFWWYGFILTPPPPHTHPHTHTHTHTHTPTHTRFISILLTISAAGSVFAACLSRISLVYCYLCSCHMSLQLLCLGLWRCAARALRYPVWVGGPISGAHHIIIQISASCEVPIRI